MEKFYLAMSWVLGIFFGILSIPAFFESLMGGLCIVAMSALLLPPVRTAVYLKTGKELHFRDRAALIIFFLPLFFTLFSMQAENKKTAELAAQESKQQAEQAAKSLQEDINYFKKNREKIISSVSAALSEKNYQSVLSQSTRYIEANDDELNSMYAEAKKYIDEKNREEKTKELLSKLKNIPASRLKDNQDLYRQLVAINPSNSAYREKLKYYSRKVNEEDAKKQREQDVSASSSDSLSQCAARGVAYFKDIGSYPTLSSAPNAGRAAEDVALERCQRTLTAF
ncbi:MAG: hypothetical protein WA154_08465 [Moraxellaceae bacterium]